MLAKFPCWQNFHRQPMPSFRTIDFKPVSLDIWYTMQKIYLRITQWIRQIKHEIIDGLPSVRRETCSIWQKAPILFLTIALRGAHCSENQMNWKFMPDSHMVKRNHRSSAIGITKGISEGPWHKLTTFPSIKTKGLKTMPISCISLLFERQHHMEM